MGYMKTLTFVILMTFSSSLLADGPKRVAAPSSMSLGRPIDWAAGVLEFFGIGDRQNHNCMKNGDGIFECFEDTGGRKSTGGAKFIKSSVEIQQYSAEAIAQIGMMTNCPGMNGDKEPNKQLKSDFETCMLYFVKDVTEYTGDALPLTKIYNCSQFFCESSVLTKLKAVVKEQGAKESKFPGAKYPGEYYGCNGEDEGEWL